MKGGNRPNKTFHLFSINCSCASYKTVRNRRLHSGKFMRCDLCNKQLGDFDILYLGFTTAKMEHEAWEKYKNGDYQA